MPPDTVYDKKPVVYSDMIYDQYEKAAVLLAVPIELNGKVSSIVVGTVPIADLNALMDQWGYSQMGRIQNSIPLQGIAIYLIPVV